MSLTKSDWLLEIAATIFLFTTCAMVGIRYSELPTLVPSHYDANGAVDSFSNKGTLLSLIGINVFLYALLSFAATQTKQFNMATEVTHANTTCQYEDVKSMIRGLKLVLMATFFWIAYSTIEIALGNRQNLGSWFLIAVLAGIAVTLGIFFWRAFRQSANRH
ncbi:MAG: DUF1648 domain-containing protein [Bacteroidetes bacterium]|nr:DUF1648 domain-containing protein [Bacteroidota bacterium]